MVEESRTYRAAVWVRALIALGAAVSIAGATALIAEQSPLWQVLLLALLALCFIAGLVESFTSRVVLSPESLQITSNFKTTTVARSEIVRVEGLKGVPAAVELRSGGWLRLPSNGSGPHPNTVRAWLRGSPEGRATRSRAT
jgi:hypothetical protein